MHITMLHLLSHAIHVVSRSGPVRRRRFRSLDPHRSPASLGVKTAFHRHMDGPPWDHRLHELSWPQLNGGNAEKRTARSESPAGAECDGCGWRRSASCVLYCALGTICLARLAMRRLIAWCHARRHRHTEVTLRLLHLRPTQPASWRPQRKASGMAACRWYRAVRC